MLDVLAAHEFDIVVVLAGIMLLIFLLTIMWRL